MASEAAIKEVLDLLTIAPQPTEESVGIDGVGHAKSMRKIVGTRNVVAIGISEKISKGKATGKLALTFYVEKKISLKNLKADAAIPPTVPESLSGPQAIPTDVVVIGKIVPEINKKRTPVEPGNSIAHVNDTAGTLGAIVTKNDQLFILSNSHVLSLAGTAKKGDAIVYPGPFDGGKMPDDLVARLDDFVKFKTGGDFVNHVDCAIAKPVPGREAAIVAAIRGLGVPKGTIKAKRGMQIVKVGRTTNKTVGEVRDVNFRFTLKYAKLGANVGFLDQVFCTRYSKPGDSGSLVLDQATGRAVGLHFAGSDGTGGGSIFNPIEEVLTALGVKLVTKDVAAPQSLPKKTAAKKKTSASSKKSAKKK